MNKWVLGVSLMVVLTTIIISAIYPEQFSMAVGFFVLGGILGGVVGYNIFQNGYKSGSQDTQGQLKEYRLSTNNTAPRQRNQPQSTVKIPKINKMTGL